MRNEPPLTFDYTRSIGPTMWMLVAIMTIEMLVIHPLIALWSPPLPVALGIVAIAVLLLLVAAIRSFRHPPVILKEADLTMRTGFLRSVELPLCAIAGVSGEFAKEEVADRSTLNLALTSWPNTIVRFVEERKVGRRRVMAVAHRLDDATGLIQALGERLVVRA